MDLTSIYNKSMSKKDIKKLKEGDIIKVFNNDLMYKNNLKIGETYKVAEVGYCGLKYSCLECISDNIRVLVQDQEKQTYITCGATIRRMSL